MESHINSIFQKNKKNSVTMLTKKQKTNLRKAKELQRELDAQHALRDYNNSLFCTDYTTKQAIALTQVKKK